MSVAVVHLVREGNGFAPFDAFMASYERHAAEHEHDLVLLFKGFDSAGAKAQYLERVGPGVKSLDVGDEGFDLTAYARAAAALEHERVCFLNSYSVLLAPGWLRALAVALDQPGVGVVGATGSWASNFSLAARQVGLPTAYGRTFADRRELLRQLHDLSGATSAGLVRDWLFAVKMTAVNARAFGSFPATHLRTNAFLIDRRRFAALDFGPLRVKEDAYRFESGRRGMTAQLVDRGLEPLLVDRHGVARRSRDWHAADAFWQADQAGLLVADNQTRAYADGSPAQRDLLSRMAWGPSARTA